jgi:6,7-dimethyl-8-ribityllumazine synthase
LEFDSSLINSGLGKKIGVVVSDYNPEITLHLLDGCLRTLIKCKVKEKDIMVIHVPGAFELPGGAQMLAASAKLDAIICLGCVIKGETKHDEYINNAVANGITQLSLLIEKPVIYGVLTTNNMNQAKDRAGGKHGNKGEEAAVTAVRMVSLRKTLKR